MKISFIILGILGILVAIFFINGCSYPTSYRAFIPKSLDSEYKEFERLCKEEIGKVVIYWVYNNDFQQYQYTFKKGLDYKVFSSTFEVVRQEDKFGKLTSKVADTILEWDK